MKILNIGGKNLASLAAEFCVDFDAGPLAGACLFAICGPTGAGKSTLLDALCLALYDATPRLVRANRVQLPDVGPSALSVQDPRNLLRRGAGEGYAQVDFVGNDGVAYRARWNVRRARGKPGGAMQPSGMTLHRLPDLIAVGGTKTEVLAEIAARIGLSFEQFTRAVLLAQNEFSAFLRTDDNERGELLETLTGSAVYSDISRRAYLRWKTEEDALARLSERLADQTPLALEVRAALEADAAAAQVALAGFDTRRAALEEQLRWHQEAQRLAAQVTLAEQACVATRAAVQEAQARRAHLAAIDALQPARPLLAEALRIDRERANVAGAHARAAQQLQQAADAQAQALAAVRAAETRHGDATQALRDAVPMLDRAKGLDAAIGALTPSHVQAQQHHATAAAQLAQAAAASADSRRTLDATEAAHVQGQAWLNDHAGWEALAAQWPRWDALFAAAGQHAQQERSAREALTHTGQRLHAASTADSAATDALAVAARELGAQDAARQQAIGALAAFDLDALQREREGLDLRREQLASADTLVGKLATTRARADEVQVQASQLESTVQAANVALAAAQAAEPALLAAQTQAERSLNVAELACADSVVNLRAGLNDDLPCPVCGSVEHPYHSQGSALDDMLAGLRAEVARCRTAARDNHAMQAGERALAQSGASQLARLAAERTSLATALDANSAEWDAHPLRGAGELQALRDEHLDARRAHDERAQAARAAANARDAAQATYDRLTARHAQCQRAASEASTALGGIRAENDALQGKLQQAASALADVLDQLDAPLLPGWRAQWQAAPQAFRAARADEAEQWRQQSASHAARAAALGALRAEVSASEAAVTQASAAHQASSAALAGIDAELATQRAARAALWEGKPVAQVEQVLGAAVEGARAALAQAQHAAQQAALMETRLREALDQTQQRMAALDAEQESAAARLAGWLSAHADEHPERDTPRDQQQLARLLAIDSAALAQERRELDALDAAVVQANTVLAERRGQREVHLNGAQPDPQRQEALAGELAALMEERQRADSDAAALRVQLAQDDERRTRAQSMMAEIEAQQLSERRWHRMADLIGSQDGKKFRNYAQQFTLDVLLGYANRHLEQLARRYRLERVAGGAGPSLALLVRDQDMGGEIRSVNSLSGGETFLVSLALALGLASLSSNRVRVESLFIDEGFGSLDSETLRVAMDALDALQAMGRKVGVISHVQEMTERIATRIVVEPAGAGASVVTVR